MEAPQQSGAFFNVSLREVLCLTEFPQAIPYDHRNFLSDSVSEIARGSKA
jgi:hypothetical protein